MKHLILCYGGDMHLNITVGNEGYLYYDSSSCLSLPYFPTFRRRIHFLSYLEMFTSTAPFAAIWALTYAWSVLTSMIH